ncbi:THO complex subunit 1 transcription elongation factor-domain-containing protein [Helicostylum pulchrum]|nr:THO complex subunit 1 transcription elongation factor-domain-containing protein [Helicostylum pulchrum]
MIESLVTQHIAPLAGQANILNVPLLKGKADWRRNATEVVFRKIFLDITLRGDGDEIYKQIEDCLDIVLHCSATDVDLLDNVTHLSFVEELLDVNTTYACEKLFDYVEKRKAKITVNLVPGKGKGLVLLRMCNILLRRLSKETNTIFCGRILMFLANTFPLCERSGVNLRGDFNTDMIGFDTDEQVDADSNLTAEQKEFYKIFWSTRVYFSNPPTIFEGENFKKLQKGTNCITQKFQVISEKEAEVSGARKSTIGTKRTRSESSIAIDEEDPNQAERLLSEINRDFQFPRLLSSRDLLDLEMEDCRFRRIVIVQYLILFQYLNGFSQAEKDKTAALLSARGATKQSLVQPNYILKDEQVKWIEDTKQMFLKLLRSTKPHGNLYTDIILTILTNERHWIIWKASGCPTFEKTPITIEELQKNWKNKKPRLSAPPMKYRYTHGNFEVSRLYSKHTQPLSDFMLNRPKIPTPTEVIGKAMNELDDSLDPSKERFDYANGALLQASRLMYRDHASLIYKVYGAKKEIYKEMRSRLNEPSSPMSVDEPPKSAAEQVIEFTIGDTISEDHVQAEIQVLTKAKNIIIDATSIKIDDDDTHANMLTAPTDKKQMIISNQCGTTLQVGYQTNDDPRGLTFELSNNGSYTLPVSLNWAGRIWARESCDVLACDIASAENPASLAEFKLNNNNDDIDYYDVSFVDGFNLPVRIEPVIIHGLDEIVQLDSKHCRRSECTSLPTCHDDLQEVDDLGNFVACNSACSRYGDDEYCCTGEFNSAETCTSNHYAKTIKDICPDSYSYAFDDATSVYGCRANSYKIVFCPQ